jgi:pyruvate/2-oxoglutarate/acetoin dehydrogenase E1 component
LICQSVSKTGHLLVVDEDYGRFGLSGELSALVLEKGISIQYQRVATMETIPYSRSLEDSVLPNVERIVDKAIQLMK